MVTKNLGKKFQLLIKRIKKKLPLIKKTKKINWSDIDLAFLSLLNGEAQKLINKIFYKYKNIKFIDLSADFRINNSQKYKRFYKRKHKASKLIKKSLYAISEFVRKSIQKV